MKSLKSFVKKYWRRLIVAAGLVILAILAWIAFGDTFRDLPHLLKVLRKGNAEEVEAFLQEQGRWKGLLVIFFFSIIQVISIIIPGMAIQIAAGVIYGWFEAFIACYLGFVTGNCLVFMFARRIGGGIGNKLMKRQKDSWLMGKINSTKPEFVFGMACLIPGIPNGIIPYIAATSKIRTIGYALAVAATSWLQIVLNCLAGQFLISGEYLFMILSFAAQIALILIMLWKRNWFLDRM